MKSLFVQDLALFVSFSTVSICSHGCLAVRLCKLPKQKEKLPSLALDHLSGSLNNICRFVWVYVHQMSCHLTTKPGHHIKCKQCEHFLKSCSFSMQEQHICEQSRTLDAARIPIVRSLLLYLHLFMDAIICRTVLRKCRFIFYLCFYFRTHYVLYSLYSYSCTHACIHVSIKLFVVQENCSKIWI